MVLQQQKPTCKKDSNRVVCPHPLLLVGCKMLPAISNECSKDMEISASTRKYRLKDEITQRTIGPWKEYAKRLWLSPAELCAACLLHGKLSFLSTKAACTFAASMQCEIEVLIAAPLSDEMPLRTCS